MSNINDAVRLIIAIDFGTTRSGFAYAFIDDSFVNDWTNWPNQPVPYAKTLSDLYIREGRVFWGWTARHQYLSDREKGQSTPTYYKNYKLALQSKRKNSAGEPVYDTGDETIEPISAVHLVTTYLREMKEYALARILSGPLREAYPNSLIRWCITVPAIWTDVDKQWMRLAAMKAGLISDTERDSRRLVFAYEPEAAAIATQTKRGGSLGSMGPGSTFMVFDAGGGTVDITSYRVGSDRTLHQLAVRTGDKCGSTYVDREFFDVYLAELFSLQEIDIYSKLHPVDWFSLQSNWEQAKCAFDGDFASMIRLPLTFLEHMRTHAPNSYMAYIEANGNMSHDALLLSQETMLGIHQKVLSAACALATTHLSGVPEGRVNYVLMVGGFSHSPLLQQHLKDAIGQRGEVIVPTWPGAAILHGAARFALDPTVVGTRMSAVTYGTDVIEEFRTSVHPVNKKIGPLVDGKIYCKDIFLPLVRAGDKISPDYSSSVSIRNILRSWEGTTTTVSCSLYSTVRNDIKYIDDPGVRLLATLAIDNIPVTKGTYPIVEVRVYIGSTELRIEAHDKATGRKVEATIRFSAAYFNEEVGISDV